MQINLDTYKNAPPRPERKLLVYCKLAIIGFVAPAFLMWLISAGIRSLFGTETFLADVVGITPFLVWFYFIKKAVDIKQDYDGRHQYFYAYWHDLEMNINVLIMNLENENVHFSDSEIDQLESDLAALKRIYRTEKRRLGEESRW